jgi:ribose 5-phosphate isomerase B
MKVFLGADHAGFSFKEQLKKFLDKKKIEYEDCGTYTPENADYPDYAFIVGRHVVEHDGLGILICGTGAGMCIAANKVPGVRAAVGYDDYSAKMSKEHNHANVLCLRSREISFTKVKKIVDVWLKSSFSKEIRHRIRLNKISAYEGMQ